MKKTFIGTAISLAIINCISPKSLAMQKEPSKTIPTVKCEIVAHIEQPIGNMTFTPNNRKIFSIHPFIKPSIRVAELTSPTSFEPFPNVEWNIAKTDSDLFLDDVLGLRGDENGIVWILDMGTRLKITPKIVGWNTKTNKLERIFYIPQPVSRSSSQLEHLVVDLKHKAIYVTDEDIGLGGDGSKGALVVVDMTTGMCRRVLEGDVSTRAEQVPIVINGRPFMIPDKDGKPRLFTIGNDGIAADKDFRWLYYGPMSGHSLYRLPIEDLLDSKLLKQELSAKVERYSDKTVNGGISIDSKGNIYSTEPEHKAIGIIPAGGGKYQPYTTDPQLGWTDAVSYSPDGFMYVSDSQLDKSSACNQGNSFNKAPYLLLRFKPLAPGRIGY